MDLICHIGLPKTGTTSIQTFLQVNKQALADQGFVYKRYNEDLPAQWEYMFVGMCLSRRLHPDPMIRFSERIPTLEDQDAMVSKFEQWFESEFSNQKGHTCIISSEHLGALMRDPQEVRGIMHWFRKHFDQLHFVIYIRRQDK